MIQPEQLKQNIPLIWSTGTGTDVWAMFCACIAGDLESVRRLIEKDPSLVRCNYTYRTPIYFAVRENRLEVTAFLLEHGADPVGNDLLEIARDRGYTDMLKLLETNLASLHGASAKGEPVAAITCERSRIPEPADRFTVACAGTTRPIDTAPTPSSKSARSAWSPSISFVISSKRRAA